MVVVVGTLVVQEDCRKDGEEGEDEKEAEWDEDDGGMRKQGTKEVRMKVRLMWQTRGGAHRKDMEDRARKGEENRRSKHIEVEAR